MTLLQNQNGFLEGFSFRWSSWNAFDDAFAVFQAKMFQQLSSRTSTSAASRNKHMLPATKKKDAVAEKKNAGAKKEKRTANVEVNAVSKELNLKRIPKTFETYLRAFLQETRKRQAHAPQGTLDKM